MADLLRVPEQAALLELAGEVAVAVLHPAPRVGFGRDLGIEAAVGADRTEQRQLGIFTLLGAQQLEVDLAEGGRDVDHAGAGVELDEVGRDDAPEARCRMLALVPVERRHVAATHELFTAQRPLDA